MQGINKSLSDSSDNIVLMGCSNVYDNRDQALHPKICQPLHKAELLLNYWLNQEKYF
jgi:hypothetical protein